MNLPSINMPKQQNIIDYKGALSYRIISQLVRKLKEEMNRLGESLVIYKRILTFMVETLENAYRYLNSLGVNANFDSRFLPFFTLSRTDSSYIIMSGNLIKNVDQAIIQGKIDRVNSLDQTELKKLYRTVIADGQITRGGGAGLGFIEIAKTCNHKIQYSFEKVNESYLFYTIRLELTR